MDMTFNNIVANLGSCLLALGIAFAFGRHRLNLDAMKLGGEAVVDDEHVSRFDVFRLSQRRE